MLCTFCGTENRPENKFCGMCGVRMDRRQGERRGLQSPAALRCPSCGHVNEAGHKFCGMCGARTDRRTLTDRRPAAAASGSARATAVANAQLPTPDVAPRAGTTAPPGGPAAAVAAPAAEEEIDNEPRNNVTVFRDERASAPSGPAPRVSGPSFLGLGDEPQSDPRYLLEDEGSSGGVLRKLVLIAILAAIGGLIFVAWRSGTFQLPGKSPTKPPAGEPATAPSPRGANQKTAPEPAPSSANKSAVTDQTPTDTPTAPATEATSTKQLQPVKESISPEGKTQDKKHPSAGADDDTEKSRTSAQALAARKPSTALLKAQQYLQGRGGVKQNCEQGLVYLRAATQQNDPAAAVQMGALYASGHCVTQDRVMAYRWFNSAHELDPGNQWIQTDLEQLWARMTPQERQKAGP